ncbi:MAG TPA: hypothetical protein VGN46_11380 [Luteibacter sp.]|jgi:hypothetical protein|uniref:hypothetical protein n=1 Tax=Luteibacter sp. TaxID=1886636 RepID=UPI002F405A17
MSDSIDLLEAVGRDASLRRLPPDELARRLKEAGASDVLANAAGQRDSAVLCEEFGVRFMGAPNHGNGSYTDVPPPLSVPAPGDDEEEGEDDDEPQNLTGSAKVH